MTNIIPVLKGVSKIPEQLKKMGKAEWADRVLAVTEGAYNQMGENLELKDQINSLKEQMREKDELIRSLKDISGLKKSMKFENDCYWGDGGQVFCSACLDKPNDPALIRMHTDGRNDGYAKCPVCHTVAWSKGDPYRGATSYDVGGDYDDPF